MIWLDKIIDALIQIFIIFSALCALFWPYRTAKKYSLTVRGFILNPFSKKWILNVSPEDVPVFSKYRRRYKFILWIGGVACALSTGRFLISQYEIKILKDEIKQKLNTEDYRKKREFHLNLLE